MIITKKYSYLILVILLSLIAVWPFFKKGYFESHDGEWMVIRFTAFHQTLVDGQFPVRFVDRLNGNFGYPVLNFLYPLPFYLSEVPKLLGVSFVDSVKIIFAVSTIASSIAMYWALSQVFTKYAAFTGAVLYLFVPYRFVDLYVRGSIGENLAFLFIPLILGSLFKIKEGKNFFLPILTIVIALLILSHNVIAVIFVSLLWIISLLSLPKKRLHISAAFLGGALVSAFFWLPALYDLQYVRASQIKVANISDHLVNIKHLIIPTWGYGPRPGIGGFSPQLGLVSQAVIVSAIFLRFAKKNRNHVVDFMLIVVAISIFLMTKPSLIIWQKIPYVDVIQFPWRLLSVTVFASAFFSAFIIQNIKKPRVAVLLIVAAAIISTIFYTKPSAFVNRGDGFYTTNEDSTTVQDEYLPLWVKEKPQKRATDKIEIVQGNAKILESTIKHSRYRVRIESSGESQVKVNTIYFPGWQVKSEGQKIPIDYVNNSGLITFKLSPGVHEVIINYTRSPMHRFSEYISLIAILIVALSGYRLWLRRDQNR